MWPLLTFFIILYLLDRKHPSNATVKRLSTVLSVPNVMYPNLLYCTVNLKKLMKVTETVVRRAFNRLCEHFNLVVKKLKIFENIFFFLITFYGLRRGL
jgi:hypothetical protein